MKSVVALLLVIVSNAGAQTPVDVHRNKYTPAQDVELGRQAAAEVEKELPLLRDEQVAEMVNRIGERLVAAILPDRQVPEFRYSFTVTNLKEINAFALPGGPMYINRGMLEAAKTEAEAAGVMAHELSHVRNFDIRFSLLVGVLVGSIALLADFFLRFTFWGGGRRSRSSNEGGGAIQIVVFVIAIMLAILAPIMARLVQMAISRQREYLADASGVELTRNPVGLERALAKIALDTEPLEVANRATQHLYFENPIKAADGRSSNLFSTHPPAIERINRLRELYGQPKITDAVQVLDAAAMRASAPGSAAFVGGSGGPPPPPPRDWNRPS